MPISDDYLVYDKQMHKYVLTTVCATVELGLNLNQIFNDENDANKSTLANRALKEISNKLYNYIYSFNPRYKLYTEYVLANNEDAREIIKECLKNELLYNIKNGDFYNYAGVNLAKGITMDIEQLRDRRVVSKLTEDMLMQPLSNGYCLLHRGYLNLSLNMRYREGY